jgi:hypothetical protein
MSLEVIPVGKCPISVSSLVNETQYASVKETRLDELRHNMPLDQTP